MPFRTLDQGPYPAPPEALPARPRRAELTGQAKSYRTMALIGMLATPNLVLLVGTFIGDDTRALRDEGRTARGVVTEIEIRHGRRGSVSYFLSYAFEVNGKPFSDYASVSRDEATSKKPGDPLVITYLPSDPNVHCLGKPEAKLASMNGWVMFLAGATFVGFGVWLVMHEVQLRRELRLARHGVGTVGMIVDCGTQMARNGTQHCWARYEVSTPRNGRSYGTHAVPQPIWVLIPRGTPVTVLFDPERPWVHQPLFAFRWVRLLDGGQEVIEAVAVEAEGVIEAEAVEAEQIIEAEAIETRAPVGDRLPKRPGDGFVRGREPY
jgi:hypothetical protein